MIAKIRMIPRTNIDIYATVPAERRKAMNDAVITNENDEQRVMNLIFERTSLWYVSSNSECVTNMTMIFFN